MKKTGGRYSNLLDQSKQRPAEPEEEPARTGKADREKGRSHPENKAKYVSTTVYLDRDIHKPVRAALLDDERDLSELVETLLSEWLQSRKASKS